MALESFVVWHLRARVVAGGLRRGVLSKEYPILLNMADVRTHHDPQVDVFTVNPKGVRGRKAHLLYFFPRRGGFEYMAAGDAAL